ncbi:MAG TPA: CYCXC family (seleno)protein [Candidatus Binataceae bacterium]|nr:CYCXC family (seleno)protein [Candidatus Binataceae bacterium]
MKTKRNKSGRTVALIVGVVAALVVGLAGGLVYQMRAAADPAASSASSLTLNPDLFQGETHDAYVVAQKHPELLAQLDCYCGCEQHEGHKNLLDCFRTNHGAGCATCVGEAVTAGKLMDQGTPVEQIRQLLRARYAHGS